MRKLTDFIVNKRNYVLILFIILAIICGFLSQKVHINDDITKYLPSSSDTRKGMDIMEDEFKDAKKTSSFNLMFKGLGEDEKNKVLEELKKTQNVSGVNYEETEEYNKDGYTLFVINVDEDSASSTASEVYKSITVKYQDYEIQTSGAIADKNTPVLPMWIIVVAVTGVLIILFFMCESYIEPWLFLFSILIAIILNAGTNIIFGTISNITSSISAILQLALSMDYSIMLINRFRQEKQENSNKVEAMKKALYHSFTAISSSSATTIVGLLCLVFMSFTIGRDLGLVLAKGVLFSLISIFAVLPALILLFDNLIEKTKKRTLNFKLDKLGAFSNKLRYPLTFIFVVIFVVSFNLKGNLRILYTASENDEVSKVFGQKNQIAIVYKNNEEEKISKHLKEIEQNDKVEEVIGYGNTINEKLSSEELNNKIKDLGSDVDVENYLLKILYYKYYNKEENNQMTFDEMVKFIKSEVYKNEKVEDKLDENVKEQINRLENFTDKDLINKKRTSSDIAKILGMDKEKIDDILVYYNSKNNDLTISLPEFVNFMNTKVLSDAKYSGDIDKNTKEELNKLNKYTNSNLINKLCTESQMAEFMGIPESNVNDLYTYYISLQDVKTKLTLAQFADFVQTEVLQDENYSKMFDEEAKSKINMLKTFSNVEIINTQMQPAGISKLFGIDEKSVTNLLYLKYMETEDATNPTIWKASPYEFVNLILSNKDNQQIQAVVSKDQMVSLSLLNNVMKSAINKDKYSYAEMAEFIGVEENSIKSIYTLYNVKNTYIKLTPTEFINFVLNHKDDDMLKGKIDTKTIKDLKLLKSIIESVNNNKKYSSKELSEFLGMDKSKLDLIYGLYIVNNSNQTMSINNMVDFLVDDVMNNKEYSGNIEENSKTKLRTVQSIIKASLNSTKYSKDEMIAILRKLSNDFDKNTVELLYMYYGSYADYNETWKMTVEEFIMFLNNDILKDSRFNDFIDEETKNSIIDSKKTIEDAREQLVGRNYSRIVLNTDFEAENNDTFEFVQKLKDLLSQDTEEFYVIGDSPMAYEMSKTFGTEFNNISILTMIAIFIVVAITFKSIIAPATLVLVIQSAVYLTMGILSVSGGSVHYIALLIVQSILMGSTIDYAILYTSYYLENRRKNDRKQSIINSYNEAIHTILTSSSILIIVTFIVGKFSTAITSKICMTLSKGTLFSTLLILFILPAILATFDRLIVKNKKK